MMSDVHDAFTSLAAHGKELPHGLTEEMKEAVDRLVRGLPLVLKCCRLIVFYSVLYASWCGMASITY
jgi:hypothetical protein